MERQPNDQAEKDDRGGDLNPNNPAKFSQHDLEPRTPGLRHLISHGFDGRRHEPQPAPGPFRMIDEGGEDHRPGRDHRQEAERVGFGQLADGWAVADLRGQHAEPTNQSGFRSIGSVLP